MNSMLKSLISTTILFGSPLIAKAAQVADPASGAAFAIHKLTANLYTDDVPACVDFWIKRLHFEKTLEVPDGQTLAFAAIRKGNIELMYGSYSSLDKDPMASHAYQRGTSFLFLEVEHLDDVFEAMAGAPLVTPIHKTFYGSTEFTVKDPAGHLITFAHFDGK